MAVTGVGRGDSGKDVPIEPSENEVHVPLH
jgi:hypothetical protein